MDSSYMKGHDFLKLSKAWKILKFASINNIPVFKFLLIVFSIILCILPTDSAHILICIGYLI
jgi:hypothetical protein